jgi:hypothetical protein
VGGESYVKTLKGWYGTKCMALLSTHIDMLPDTPHVPPLTHLAASPCSTGTARPRSCPRCAASWPAWSSTTWMLAWGALRTRR